MKNSKYDYNRLARIIEAIYNLNDTELDCYFDIFKSGGVHKEDINCKKEILDNLENKGLIQKFPKETGHIYIPTPIEEIALKLTKNAVDILNEITHQTHNPVIAEIPGILIFGERYREKYKKNPSVAIVKDIIKNAKAGTQIKLRVRRLSTFNQSVYPDFVDDIISKELNVKVLLVSEQEEPYDDGIKTAKDIQVKLGKKKRRFQVRISQRKSEHLRYLIADDIVMFVVGRDPHTGILIKDEQLATIFENDFNDEFEKAIPLSKYTKNPNPYNTD